MATYTGSISGTMSSHHKIQLVCTETSQSIANNTTTVKVSLQLYSDGSGASWKSGCPYTITVNGTKYTGTFNLDTRGSAHTDTIATVTQTIKHGDDGKKSITVSGGFTTSGINGITSAQVGSTTWNLTTIPRASGISSVTSSVTANGSNAVAITLDRKASAFRHKVSITFGSRSETISNVTTSTSYVIPVAWLDQIKTATSGTATVKVQTYSDSDLTTTIGSAVSKTFTIKVPSYSPKVTASASPVYSVTTDSSWGWVAGRTKAKITASASTSYSATIKSYSITGTGITATGSSATSSSTLSAGTHKYTIVATDTRGLTASTTISVVVSAYSNPVISKATATRNSVGAVNVAFTFSCTKIGNNSVKGSIQYRVKGETSWTMWNNAFTSGSTGTIDLNTDKSYDILFTATDKYLTSSVSKAVSTVLVTIDLLNGGKGVSIGKVAEFSNVFDVSWNTYIRGHLSVGYGLDTERSIYFTNTGNGKYPHQCRLYGGNADSKTGIGFYDSHYGRGVFVYNDVDNYISSASSLSIAGKMVADNYRLTDSAGIEKAVLQTVDGDSNGIGVLLSGGGLTVVGAGESPTAYVNKHGYVGSSEHLHLTSDNNIHFAVSCNTIADSKKVILNGSHFSPEVTKAFSMGTSSLRWNNGYFNTVYNSAGVITSSDARLKKDIQPINQAKDFILGLEAVQYSYINGDSGRTHYGFKAQQVKETMETVGIEDCGVYVELPLVEGKDRTCCNYDELELGVRYEELIPPLIDLVQNQQKEIEELKELTKSLLAKFE